MALLLLPGRRFQSVHSFIYTTAFVCVIIVFLTGRGERCDLPAVFARVRQHLPFIAEVLYDEGYSGWSSDRTVRKVDVSKQYSKADYAVEEPDHTDRLAVWEKTPEDKSAFLIYIISKST